MAPQPALETYVTLPWLPPLWNEGTLRPWVLVPVASDGTVTSVLVPADVITVPAPVPGLLLFLLRRASSCPVLGHLFQLPVVIVIVGDWDGTIRVYRVPAAGRGVRDFKHYDSIFELCNALLDQIHPFCDFVVLECLQCTSQKPHLPALSQCPLAHRLANKILCNHLLQIKPLFP